ncbi:MAG: undecaprenyl-phosphate glucose phosphotransferase [Clostridiales bacterium]|nr:undecaprenyl-phosphate glucose phosphotransferase [Clostridiales bacterium]
MLSSYKSFSSKVIFMAIDILSIVFALITSIWLRFYSGFFVEVEGIQIINEYFASLFVIIPVYIVIYFSTHLYKKSFEMDYFKEIRKILGSNMIAALVLMSITFMVRLGTNFSRWTLVFFIGFNILYDIVFRLIYRIVLIQILRKGPHYHILVLGTGKLAAMYLKQAQKYKKLGYEIVGLLASSEQFLDKEILGYSVLGTFDEFHKLHQKYHFNEVVVALHIGDASYIQQILNFCDAEGVRIRIIPGYYEYMKYSTYIEDFEGIPILTVRGVPLDQPFHRFVKRVFDIGFSIFALVISSPLLIFIMLIQKIESPKDKIFFLQERVGLNNETFIMYKFRSMKDLPPELEEKQWSKENDPRVTKFGKFLRKTSLDEFPQFVNVLKGDMSVVGPRPERPFWVGQFKGDIPQYMLRHYVKSGITGWAQVNGLRGDTSIEERVKFDNYYIQNWSLLFDIKIIFLTVFGKNTKHNAY